MPLGGRLTDAEIAIVKEWIDSGAEWDSGRALVRRHHYDVHREEIHRAAASLLGLPKSSEASRARRKGQRMGAKPDRRVHSRRSWMKRS